MNYYEILGVATDASIDQIHIVYRRLARMSHPDVGGDSEQFKKFTEAYDTLGDPVKRMAYDRQYKVYNIYSGRDDRRLIMPLCKKKTHKELLDELVNTEWEIIR